MVRCGRDANIVVLEKAAFGRADGMVLTGVCAVEYPKGTAEPSSRVHKTLAIPRRPIQNRTQTSVSRSPSDLQDAEVFERLLPVEHNDSIWVTGTAAFVKGYQMPARRQAGQRAPRAGV